MRVTEATASTRPQRNARFRNQMPLMVAGSSLAILSFLSPSRAVAQTAAANSQPAASGEALEEVVVTAQRRKENLQDVPVAVEAFSATQIQDSVVTSNTDLGMITPGLVSASQFGYFQPHLRGIGAIAPSSSVEGQVAVYVDGVYYGVQAGSIFELAGIDHIEVDKGPQGTLFGRNATAGLIQIVTKDPEPDFSGQASLTLGDYSTVGTSLYVTGGITDKLAANLSVYFQNQGDGYGKNQFNGQDVNLAQDMAFRHKLKFTPTDDDTILLALDYEQDHSAPVLIPAPGTTPLGGPPYTGSPWGADGYYQPRNIEKQGGVSLKIDHDFGFARFQSITAYLQSSLYSAFDGTLVTNYADTLNIELWDLHNQFTQELTLSSEPDSPITWTTGVYFFDSDARYEPVLLTGGLLNPLVSFSTFSDTRTVSVAPFAQATAEIFDATNLTLGVRYTIEQKHFWESQYGGYGGPQILFGSASNVPLNNYKPTWRVSVDHKLTPDVLVYASYNRGFKTGGFSDQILPATTYAPETLDAYEVGAKSSFFDHRLEINAAGFYYNYSNIQVVSYPAGVEIIYNAPKAELYGLDLDFKASPFTNFTVSGGLEILHDAFTVFPAAQRSTPIPGGGTLLQCTNGPTLGSEVAQESGCLNAAGNRLPIAPDWTFDIAPLYVVPLGDLGDLTLGAVVSYNDGFYFEPDNRLHQGPYTVVNASATWDSPDELYSVQLWAKNLTDEAYTTARYSQGNGDYAVYAPPRTYGVTVKRNF